MKNKIREYYQELQGYLSQTLTAESPYSTISNEESWEQVHRTIDLINNLDEDIDYSRFKITPKHDGGSSPSVNLMVFRQKLNGLIGALHAEHFQEEDQPFSGKPSTIISQNQSQEQTVNVTYILQLQEKIIKKLDDKTTTKEEKAFLTKVKESLGTVKGGIETLNLILSTAKAFGIEIARLAELFQ